MEIRKYIPVFRRVTFVLIAFLFSACGPTPDKKVEKYETEEQRQEIEKQQQEKYTTFNHQSDSIIAVNEKTIASLQSTADKKNQKDKEESIKWLRVLGQRNQMLKKRLHDYKIHNDELWEGFKDEFNHDMKKLNTALERLSKNEE